MDDKIAMTKIKEALEDSLALLIRFPGYGHYFRQNQDELKELIQILDKDIAK